MKSRRACLPWTVLFFTLFALGLVALLVYVPVAARQSFGDPSPSLNAWQRYSYGFELAWNAEDLTQPLDPAGTEHLFIVEPGDSAYAIAGRLQQVGLIRSARTFRLYLAWTGMDTVIQTGTYRLSPAQPARDIAGMLKSTTLTEVNFAVLPGWRIEEIAATLSTSGLGVTSDEFIRAAMSPAVSLDLFPAGASAEGFLAPGEYILPRTTTADQLVSVMVQRFPSVLTPELQSGFTAHGLTVYQAVTLASIIQREAVAADELPTIASVFYNRLGINMKLQSDPTVQYALGFNAIQGKWWTNPLSTVDMQYDSPYNTYLYSGLPPGPISNPGTDALAAVASPAQTKYYFFQAKCDGSGLHNFSETFEQHQQNYCP
jgi:UPF0755 protein